MGLKIDTFSNVTGGASLFKALGHPLAAERAAALKQALKRQGKVAIYDPWRQLAPFLELYPADDLDIHGVFVQDIERIGETLAGHRARPVTDLADEAPAALLIAAFDSDRPAAHVRPLLPAQALVVSFDDLRLPDDLLTVPGAYLDPLNFATNFAFFRDADGQHTRITTANYWARYGGKDMRYWARLFDRDGRAIAEWTDPLPAGDATLRIDSADIRRRFDLSAFEGQLFLHVVGAAGHDVIKYALDLYGDDPTVVTCTHDANAWPADLYAGLPAPRDGETVVLWVQNSHPCPIPAGGVGLNRMGHEDVAWLDRELPAFASYPLNVAALLPDLRYPAQIEVQAGKYFVRPRYEILNANGRTRMAHANVERTDLEPDPKIKTIGNLMGRGFVLPAPILPRDRFGTAMLPTPMATGQTSLPVGLSVFSPAGDEKHYQPLGCLRRSDSVWYEIDDILEASGGFDDDTGHIELVYDFSDGGDADGWLHAIFRYEERRSGHEAETSFGAHIFNHILTYRNEPQSYNGPAPGLSTRLFLRLGDAPLDTMCHLINPVAAHWGQDTGDTRLVLHRRDGEPVARCDIRIPPGGSCHWRYSERFSAAERRDAGDGAYVLVRDPKQRLFGYHGLMNGDGAFSLDHMFGF